MHLIERYCFTTHFYNNPNLKKNFGFWLENIANLGPYWVSYWGFEHKKWQIENGGGDLTKMGRTSCCSRVAHGSRLGGLRNLMGGEVTVHLRERHRPPAGRTQHPLGRLMAVQIQMPFFWTVIIFTLFISEKNWRKKKHATANVASIRMNEHVLKKQT